MIHSGPLIVRARIGPRCQEHPIPRDLLGVVDAIGVSIRATANPEVIRSKCSKFRVSSLKLIVLTSRPGN
jgi:hypothetical protein